MHSIFTIVKKELRRSFTDVRVLLGMLLPGLIIFFMYTFMGSIISNVEQKQTSYTSFYGEIINEPTEFKDFLEKNKFELTGLEKSMSESYTKEEYMTLIKNKEADIYIVYPENFMEKAEAHRLDPDNTPIPNVEIYYNSAKDESSLFFQEYIAYLNEYESTKCNMFDYNNDPNTVYNLVNKDDASRKFLSMMLPFMLIIFIFSGALSFCADSFAGEKERGTMATLLMTPTKRSQIAIGKILALCIMALVSATASFLGILLSLPKMLGSASSQFNFNVYGPGTYILLFLVVISITLFFIAVLAIISAFSKSVKEASSLSLPVMVVVMLIGITGFMSNGAASNPVYYLIPVYNAVQTLVGLLSGNMNTMCLLVAVLSNLFYVIVIVFLLTKMLNSEKIMFKK